MDETTWQIAFDFLIWLYKVKQLAIYGEVEGEPGKEEWSQLMDRFQDVVNEYVQFVEEKGSALEAFAPLEWLWPEEWQQIDALPEGNQ